MVGKSDWRQSYKEKRKERKVETEAKKKRKEREILGRNARVREDIRKLFINIVKVSLSDVYFLQRNLSKFGL